ncbi:MAG: hypothetical protein HC941_31235 [Microcoleus sp. SU_5_3]|nr:hypothetical protein [Microcoleus sp. SU_5_3]
MQNAISLYLGGEVIDATSGDYTIAKELGLVCPFCREAVFFAKEHDRVGVKVRSAWRHYKTDTTCENRARTSKDLELLEKLSLVARGQRLKLFNQRFWDIFRQQKDIPPKMRGLCDRIVGKETFDRIIKHCRDKWDTPAIVRILPETIKTTIGNSRYKEILLACAQKMDISVSEEGIDRIVQKYASQNFSIVRYKILCEVIEWLPSRSASESFERLIQLSFLDCYEQMPLPIHATQIAWMAIVSLTITDWEVAIANLSSKGVGFGGRCH